MAEDRLPPRVPPSIRRAPRIRQIYWCDFPLDAQLPEFWKRRPVLILSRKFTLHGNVTVLPITTKSQPDNDMAYPLDIPNMQRSWVICDYLTTVAVSRLHLPGHMTLRIGQEDFNKIAALVLKGLPRPDHTR